MYGYWQYEDTIGLSCDIEKYDLVYVFKYEGNMAYAVNEKGKVILFHKDHVAKGFGRPSYQFHKECSLGTRSKHFYCIHDAGNERHKNDCHKCQMYKFKQTVKRFKLGQK
jgi:hypothetical protein